MKSILLLLGVVLCFTTTGCIIVEHRGRGEFHEHEEFRGHVGPPVFVEPELDLHFHAD